MIFSKILYFPLANRPFELAKLLWLVRLRWAAFVIFFVLSYPFYIHDYLTNQSLVIYVGILSFVFLFNLLTQMYFQEKKHDISPFVLVIQSVFDLVILSTLLFISGGYQNPMIGFFYLNTAIAAVLIRGRYSWPFIFIVHSFIFFLQIDFYQFSAGPAVVRPSLLQLISIHFLILALWFVMRKLGADLESHFEQQKRSVVQLGKADRLRSLGALAAGFSHEFASPLNALKMNLDWLQKNQFQLTPQSVSEALAKAQLATQACIEVVHQMNSSQLDARNYEPKQVNLSDLTLDIIGSWKEQNPTALCDEKIQSHIYSEVPVLNYAQVLINLLDNAFQATSNRCIEMSLIQQDSQIRLKIRDFGFGFPEIVLKNKGQPFLTTKPNGTGLGLYVTDLFVESLSGEWQLWNEGGAVVQLSWKKRIHT